MKNRETNWLVSLIISILCVLSSIFSYAFTTNLETIMEMAQAGDAEAQNQLARMYYFGDGVRQDDKQAAFWIKKSAGQGFAYAQDSLRYLDRICNAHPTACEQATSSDSGEQIGISFQKTITESEASIKQHGSGDDVIIVMEQFRLANSYYTGEGAEKDYEKAAELYMSLGEQGHPEAQFILGVMYREGQGVNKDNNVAFRCFWKSAEQGYAKAQFGVGVMYYEGQGVLQDSEAAVRWFKKAAAQGDVNAEYGLGYLYLEGDVTEESQEEAFKWLNKAANKGHAEAQHALGNLYYGGNGIRRNANQAVMWYRKAAEQGKRESQRIYESLCIESNLANCPSKMKQEYWIGPAPAHIYFDSTNPAYCHMIAINNLEDFLKRIKGKEEEIKKLISGEKFFHSQADYLDGCQIINDYPGYNVKKEVGKILSSYDGAMFSITWNGGIAFTVSDHNHTERIYEKYKSDPKGYLILGKRKQAFDRINPGHHLRHLLQYFGKAQTPIKEEDTE
jgi:TPR repeat protein